MGYFLINSIARYGSALCNEIYQVKLAVSHDEIKYPLLFFGCFFLNWRTFPVLNNISFNPFTKYEVFDHTTYVIPTHIFPVDCELVTGIKIFPFEILAC